MSNPTLPRLSWRWVAMKSADPGAARPAQPQAAVLPQPPPTPFTKERRETPKGLGASPPLFEVPGRPFNSPCASCSPCSVGAPVPAAGQAPGQVPPHHPTAPLLHAAKSEQSRLLRHLSQRQHPPYTADGLPAQEPSPAPQGTLPATPSKTPGCARHRRVQPLTSSSKPRAWGGQTHRTAAAVARGPWDGDSSKTRVRAQT